MGRKRETFDILKEYKSLDKQLEDIVKRMEKIEAWCALYYWRYKNGKTLIPKVAGHAQEVPLEPTKTEVKV